MSDGLFWMIVLIPMIFALWAFAGLRDLVSAAKDHGIANANTLVPVDKPGMDDYVRNPIAGTIASPRMIIATLRFVATPQSAAPVERLRRQYLTRLLSVVVSLLASLTALIVLSSR